MESWLVDTGGESLDPGVLDLETLAGSALPAVVDKGSAECCRFN